MDARSIRNAGAAAISSRRRAIRAGAQEANSRLAVALHRRMMRSLHTRGADKAILTWQCTNYHVLGVLWRGRWVRKELRRGDWAR
jgi:hypothetical protein